MHGILSKPSGSGWEADNMSCLRRRIKRESSSSGARWGEVNYAVLKSVTGPIGCMRVSARSNKARMHGCLSTLDY